MTEPVGQVEPLEKPSKVARRRALVRELQIILATLTVAVAVTIPAVILVNQKSGHKLLQDVDRGTNNSQQLLEYVKDCTTPSGACYKQNAANQVAVLGKVELIVVLAASCAKQPENQTVTQISVCVEKGLK